MTTKQLLPPTAAPMPIELAAARNVLCELTMTGNGGHFGMDNRNAGSLAQFCIDQYHEFDAGDWHLRLDIDGKAVALAAKYLSMTSWYGHELALERIAAASYPLNDTSHGLHRESHAIGFDLPHFSVMVRIGIAKARQRSLDSKAGQARSEHVAQNRDVMGAAAGEHEQMPDAMGMGEVAVQGIEDDANRIEEAAGH